MFYGRVDVYWPDGPVESYRLNKTTIAIGRSTGNDIVLDTTAISRYHITFTFTDQQVFLEDLDSVNGTYADGVRLEPHTPHQLRGGEEIQIGEIRLIFHPPLEEATLPTSEDTQRVILSQPTFKVELEGPDIPVAPGAHVKARLKVENLGTNTDRFQIELDGLPKGWARIDTNEIELEPGEQNQAMISLKPLRRSESKPGDHPFVVRVRSKATPTEVIDAPAILHVLPYSGFGMALQEMHIRENDKFQLYVHNQGNAPLHLNLSGTDPAQILRFQLGQERIQLGPGERRTISGKVRLHQRRLFGDEREHEFALAARAQDPSGFIATVPGSFVEKGMLPSWVPILAVPGLILAMLLVIVLVLWAVGGGSDEKPAVQPVITQFSISQPAIVIGQSVTVTWEVSDAQRLTLVREREGTQEQFEIDPALPSFDLLFDQTGQYTLVLNAENGKLVDTRTAALAVLPSVALQLQVLDGSELVRNVQYTLRATWQVQGAQTFDNGYRIWLERVDILQPVATAPQALISQYDFPVVVSNDQSELTITLYAEGRDGVTTSITEQLPTVYPSCETHAEQVILREGPNLAYAPVGEPLASPAEGSLSFSPLARDSSGQWLQVSVGVENIRIGWVPLTDFNCTNFEPSRLRPSNDYPPLPEPTVMPATPTVTPSLVPTLTPTTSPG